MMMQFDARDGPAEWHLWNLKLLLLSCIWMMRWDWSAMGLRATTSGSDFSQQFEQKRDAQRS